MSLSDLVVLGGKSSRMIRDQYEVELENTYNVYEKGFAIGMTERSNASNRFKVIILSGLRFWFVLVG